MHAHNLSSLLSIVANATSPKGSIVTFNASAIDSNGNPVSVNCTPPSGHLFPPGNTNVTCTALTEPNIMTVQAGSNANKTFTVAVRMYVDTSPPKVRHSISLGMDRSKYSSGEAVQIFGNVYDEKGNPVNNESITIQVKRLPNSIHPVGPLLSIPKLLFGLMGQQKSVDDFDHQLVYKTSLYPTNGSYLASFVTTDNPDMYNVTASLTNTRESSSSTFQVEDLFTTISSNMLYLAVVFIFILLLVPMTRYHSMRLVEISSFISISALVLFMLLGLVFADAEIGANSPVGLVLKHPSNDKGQIQLDKFGRPEQGGEWVINFGGNQHNNYFDGIQIPVYVPALGLAGGYLRFLYETATKHHEIMGEYQRITKEVFSTPPAQLFPLTKKRKSITKIYIGIPGTPISKILQREEETEA